MDQSPSNALDISWTTLVSLVSLHSGFFSLFGFSSLNNIYVYQYCSGYPPQKAYLDRWYSNHKLLHDGWDVLNPQGGYSLGNPGQLPLQNPNQPLVFS